jgi:Uma2 family endonuclease
LVDGVLIEKAMGAREACLAMYLGSLLIQFVRPRRLGIVGGADMLLRLAPQLVRMPDVCFVSHEQIRDLNAQWRPIMDFAPELAVEVLSESNTPAEMAQKRAEYFAAGTRLVWEIDAATRTVQVFTGPDAFTQLHESDTLTGGDVLPGFTLNLTEFFNDPLLTLDFRDGPASP